jgi:multidrug efflux pump subunit AcrA (membrane-fusion protein)
VGNYAQLLVPLSLTVSELNALKDQQHNLLVRLPEFNQSVPAKIARISPAFDDQSRKVLIDLILENNLPVYRGGLRIEVNLKIPDADGTFLVSETALEKRFEEVWVERKDSSPLRVDLLGHTENDLVRIASPEIKIGDLLKILKP